ncbi:hypothetical protein AUR04nite_05210 [Glutamicibacter uratoxydans]|uniref:Uncharacterized protein n=1 Tax=Glutamicibacter uratoxydans TaxID=43667 RepID=A0A4Y4DI88_GLUUR|nr:hypothetical protein [Glutamicibacter uratoxydans]GED04989.1 hypothetical protein AUR04nite_05210 [Glutamicibacter uratoxydans]
MSIIRNAVNTNFDFIRLAGSTAKQKAGHRILVRQPSIHQLLRNCPTCLILFIPVGSLVGMRGIPVYTWPFILTTRLTLIIFSFIPGVKRT